MPDHHGFQLTTSASSMQHKCDRPVRAKLHVQANGRSRVSAEAKENASRDARIQQLEAALQQEASQQQKRADADAEAIATREDAIAELEVTCYSYSVLSSL